MAVIIAVAIAFFISFQVFGGSVDGMVATPGYLSVLFINALIGVSIALFIVELRVDAVRVLITVAIALVFGYLMTMAFNFDSANRFVQGAFKVSLLSDAQAVENSDMDMQYGQTRSGTFNDPEAAEPVKLADFRFEGHAGDVVTVLAFAANRRSQIDTEVALIGPNGDTLAESTSATAEQLQTYDDLIGEKDAVIENYQLPADGVYTIRAQPEPIGTDVVLREATAETNKAYEAFLFGPLQRVNRWATWIQDAITLIMLGMAIAIVFTARQFSLGAEGQIYLGALLSGIVILGMTNVSPIIVVPLALLAAAVTGFLWGLLPGVLKAYLGANELVATLMMNTVAVKLFDLVLNFRLKPPQAGGLFSDWFPKEMLLSPIVEGTGVTTGLYLLLGIVILSWLLIRRTPLGYEIRMIGANIKFADYGGVNTRRTVMLSMAISGIVAGLAGAHLAMGIQGRLVAGISSGLAFEGVVVALLARNNPLVVPFTGLLYSYMRAGAQFMERDANVSFEVVRVIQAVIILLITAEALLAFIQRQRIRRRGTIELEVEPEKLLTQRMAAEEQTNV